MMNGVFENGGSQGRDGEWRSLSRPVPVRRERKFSEHQWSEEAEGKAHALSRSLSPTRFDRGRPNEFDVPFFTVARYRNPVSPTTYELAAVPLRGSNEGSSNHLDGSFPSAERNNGTLTLSKSADDLENDDGELSSISPVEIAFGKGSSLPAKEWLGKSVDLHQTTPNRKTPDSPLSKSLSESNAYNYIQSKSRLDQSNCERAQVTTQYAIELKCTKSHSFDEIPVRGHIDPHKRNLSNANHNSSSQNPDDSNHSFSLDSPTQRKMLRPLSLPGTRVNGKTVAVSSSLGGPTDVAGLELQSNRDSSVYSIYDDASVTDVAETLADLPPTPTSSCGSWRFSASARKENGAFTLRTEGERSPQTEEEYLSLLHRKLLEAHERQLYPLKEDVADWLANLLGENDVTADNLEERLQNGVLVCRLADAVSAKARESRDRGLSTLEVPSLPYKTWKDARRGSFFARDNVSNFLRFCKRLGVRSSLLFETEDLVCGSGIRSVVLCLLEVGRLSQMWWNLEPPGLVKLEKEMDVDEMSFRSDSGYSNTSSPRDSTLALNPLSIAPLPSNSPPLKPPRPQSAPGPASLKSTALKAPSQSRGSNSSAKGNRTGADFASVSRPLPGASTCTGMASQVAPRGPKPVPPPKPASIKRAIAAITNRPSNFTPSPCDRRWSGAQTNPTGTPVTTPTKSRTRLPVAKTPRSSGRSTPNTTPTTPTHGRKSVLPSGRSPYWARASPSTYGCEIPGASAGQGGARPSVYSRTRRAHTDQTDAKTLQTDLDNRVRHIASSTQGVCLCSESSCLSSHVRRISDGTYEVLGKTIFVRLLKGKHVMVRVGGGWDTFEHYLLRHDPNQVRFTRRRENYQLDKQEKSPKLRNGGVSKKILEAQSSLNSLLSRNSRSDLAKEVSRKIAKLASHSPSSNTKLAHIEGASSPNKGSVSIKSERNNYVDSFQINTSNLTNLNLQAYHHTNGHDISHNGSKGEELEENICSPNSTRLTASESNHSLNLGEITEETSDEIDNSP